MRAHNNLEQIILV